MKHILIRDGVSKLIWDFDPPENWVETAVWPPVPATAEIVQYDGDVEFGWGWDGVKFSAPVEPLETSKARSKQSIATFARFARTKILGTDDPAKIAEYADKAQSVSAILNDTATPGQLAEATAEAARMGLADAKAMAEIWLIKADALRGARQEINQLVSDAITAIDAAQTTQEISVLGGQLTDAAEAKLAALLAGA